jgi:hypothetical protein
MGLTLKEYANAKGLPIDFLKNVGLEDIDWWGEPAVRIPYGGFDGVEVRGRVRIGMDGDRFRWEKGKGTLLYGVWRSKNQNSKEISLVEGESDCHTLWTHGFPALGLPGAGNWNEDWAKFLERYQRIYVAIEPDRGGKVVLRWVRNSQIRERVRLITLEGVKDASELYSADRDNFRKNWRAAMEAATPCPDLPAEDQQPKLTQTKFLLRLADRAALFHTPADIPFASVPANGHIENWALRSKRFQRWLLRAYYQQTKTAPQNQNLQESISVLESKALFEGPESPTFMRLAENDAKFYVDLSDSTWGAIEVDIAGWRLIPEAPAKFRRARGMSPLPRPIVGGSIEQLRRFINVANERDWILVIAWLLAALRPRGPYPILALHGEQGSAKSTTARVLRALVDPNTAPLRSEPRELRDLMIAASNGWVIVLDNISRIPMWLSDALCRLSTGGGFSTRELYTDDEEILIDAQRPVILNGIEELAVRSDLLDRSLILYLPPIPEDKRQPEDEFWRDFEAERPAIIGGLLDVVSGALRRLPKIRLTNTPRLADFAVWATAAERTLGWEDGTFMRAYTRNQSDANDLALDASPVSEPVRRLVTEGEDFEGTATQLLNALAQRADESTRNQRGWPRNGQGLSNILRRLAPNLRKAGTEVEFGPRGKNRQRKRLITVRNIASIPSTASKRSLTSR